jgi:type I restriction enzyme, R subunit
MPTEADTCRKLVVPKLQAAGWDNDPFSIAEQRTITDGRIVPVGKSFIRRPPKRVDYLLRYRRDFPLAVVEAKAEYRTAADALQQAKNYAEMLGLKFVRVRNRARNRGQALGQASFVDRARPPFAERMAVSPAAQRQPAAAIVG